MVSGIDDLMTSNAAPPADDPAPCPVAAFCKASRTAKRSSRIWGALALALSLALLLSWPLPARAQRRQVPKVVGLKLPKAILRLSKQHFEAAPVPKYTRHPGEHLKVFKQLPRPGSLPGGHNNTITIWYYDAKPGPGSPLPPAPEPGKASPSLRQRLLDPDAQDDGYLGAGSKSPFMSGSSTPQAPPPGFMGPRGLSAEKPSEQTGQNAQSGQPGGDEPYPVLVPYLQDSTLAEAKRDCAKLGLKLQVVGETDPYDRTQSGLIAEQIPSAGVRLRPGSTVRVFVYSNVLPEKSFQQRYWKRKHRKQAREKVKAEQEAREKELEESH